MKQAISQESMSDSGHSYSSQESEQAANSRAKSAAMLGIALSVGASGALISTAEASAAISAPTVSDTTKAFSSESKASASESSENTQAQVVAYHTVESGESLWQIAQQHRVGLQDLKIANELPPETAIRVGQVLRVPAKTTGLRVASAVELAETAQATGEVVETENEPTLLAQSAEASAEQPVQASGADALRTEAGDLAVGGADPDAEAANGAEVANVEPTPSIEIEIADASAQISARTESARAESARAESEPVVTALASPQPSFNNYQIQAGDTLASIASSLGTTTQDIARANGLSDPNLIITGSTLRVPAVPQEAVARATVPEVTSEATETRSTESPRSSVDVTETQSSTVFNGSRLAYLQSTAVRPDSARLLGELRSAETEPVEATVQDTSEQDVVSAIPSDPATLEEVRSVDPYVANLLEEVQAVRETDIQVSEAAPESIEGNDDGSSLLARSIGREEVQASEDIALAPESTASADSELLAAAPLSPEAYIPAQRSAAGQVVSPDMPLLPDSEEFLPEAPERFNGYIWPAQGTLTSGYGWRWGRMHRGLDIAGPVGTPIVAAAMGVVEQAGWNSGGYGNLVEIRHPDGSMTRYAHNNRLNVSAGQTVRQGQKIAEMGSTGYSTGPHLHFEIHASGQGAVNPVAYLPGR